MSWHPSRTRLEEYIYWRKATIDITLETQIRNARGIRDEQRLRATAYGRKKELDKLQEELKTGHRRFKDKIDWMHKQSVTDAKYELSAERDFDRGVIE